MEGFTRYDDYTQSMLDYLRNYGPHFNRKLCDFAVSLMEKREGDGKMHRITPYTKDAVDSMLRNARIELRNSQLYDHVYVANMCKADYLGSSVVDEMHLALYVKDTIDDPDAEEGLMFNRWYADMCYMGKAIDWEEML